MILDCKKFSMNLLFPKSRWNCDFVLKPSMPECELDWMEKESLLWSSNLLAITWSLTPIASDSSTAVSPMTFIISFISLSLLLLCFNGPTDEEL